MNTITKRTAAALAAFAATAACTATFATSASADPGDPVTGGTTTLSLYRAGVVGGAKAGFTVLADSPATESNNTSGSTVDFAFPVSGGDGSENAGFGSVEHNGGLSIYNTANGTSVDLTDVVFHVDTVKVSAVPAGTTKARNVFIVGGSHTFSDDPSTGRQEFTGTDLRLAFEGAKYLDNALHTTVFKAGQHLGSFDTVFYNSQF